MNCKLCNSPTIVVTNYNHPSKIERRRKCTSCGCYNFSIEQWFDRARALDERVNKKIKITPKMVREIRELVAKNKPLPPSERMTQKEIGERFGISQKQVSSIWKKDSWRYL